MRQNIVEITLTMKTNLCGWVVKFEKQRQISFHAILLTRACKNKKHGKIQKMAIDMQYFKAYKLLHLCSPNK